MTKRLLELQDQHDWSFEELSAALDILGEGLSLGLHHMGWCTLFIKFTCRYQFPTAFLPVILSQGSEEQVKSYGCWGKAHAILGSYAQVHIVSMLFIAMLLT